ncbi:MAG: oligosaccharide flippase family protein, partial [Nitrospinota bacterium]
MSTAARVFRNSGAVLAGQGLERLLKLVVIILLARYLQARGFGTYAFIFAYVELFAVITDLGVNAILVREVSRERERAGELLGSALLLKGLLTLAALGLCWGIIAALSYPGQIKLLVFVASAILILSFRVNSFRMTFDAVYQAELEMKYPMALGAMSEALSAVLILLAIAKGLGLGGIVLLQVAAYLPGFIALGVLFQRRVRPVYRVDLALWKRLLSLAFPIALANLFIMAYSRADLLMLSFMKGDESVGFYASALKLVGSLGIIPLALSTSLHPLIARY